MTKRKLLPKKNQSGFTMIELLVGIFIIAMISGIFLANYRSSDENSKLKNAADKFASDIRLAENYTLGSRKHLAGIDPPDVPSGGWGVYLNIAESAGVYKIFADKNANRLYDSGEEEKEFVLPDGVLFSATTKGDQAVIVFMPPDPDTFINGGRPENITITLHYSRAGTIAYVYVNSEGLVESTY
ncbi:MAG: prepilin-type N-terminal cleavage/methylation domain-containing protein [Patescibacteria group bacterium]|jgi:prepilin-type N-terminal cleavage/methylation domain-containing protein